MKKAYLLISVLLLITNLGFAQSANHKTHSMARMGLNFGGGTSLLLSDNSVKPYFSALFTSENKYSPTIKSRSDIGYILSQSEHTYWAPQMVSDSWGGSMIDYVKSNKTYALHGICADTGLKIKPFGDGEHPFYFFVGLNLYFSAIVKSKPNINSSDRYNSNFGGNAAIGFDLDNTAFIELYYSQPIVHFGTTKINLLGLNIGFYFSK